MTEKPTNIHLSHMQI